MGYVIDAVEEVDDTLDIVEKCDEARDEEEEMELALSEGRREPGCETAGEFVG
jgi:hypothetical protein